MYGASKLLDDLANALATAIEGSNVPNVCFCGVIPGTQVAMDFGVDCDGDKQGMAWVRQISMYPAEGLNRVAEMPNNCPSATGMDIEVGIARTIPVIDGVGNLPTPEDYRNTGILMNDDAVVIRKAINGCVSDIDLDYILGTYEPFGPLGVVIGGSWSMAVLLD